MSIELKYNAGTYEHGKVCTRGAALTLMAFPDASGSLFYFKEAAFRQK